VTKCTGLGITIFAILLGAPFWFDVLQKLVSLRSSGTRPPTEEDGRIEKKKRRGHPGDGDDDLDSAGKDQVHGPPDRPLNGPIGMPGRYWEDRRQMLVENPALQIASVVQDVAGQDLSAFTGAITASTRIEHAAKARRIVLAGAQLSEIAYHDCAMQKILLEEEGFDENRHIFLDKAGTQVCITTAQNVHVIAFRGTEAGRIEDILTDVRATLRSGQSINVSGMVHTGFLLALQAVMTDLDASVDSAVNTGCTTILLCGHSLGGALAMLYAARLWNQKSQAKIPDRILALTYGAPRVGDRVFMNSLMQSKNEQRRLVRVMHRPDPIPLLPPMVSGYGIGGDHIELQRGRLEHVTGSNAVYRALELTVTSQGGVVPVIRESAAHHAIKSYINLLEQANM